MNKLTNFVRKLKLRQILTVFVAGLALFISTACNNGTATGARPENPPVQMGGMNNPHKNGGDGYTNYKMSTDPNVKGNATKGDRASLPVISQQLIAAGEDLLYPASDSNGNKFNPIVPGSEKVLQPESEAMPAQRQPIVDRTDPDAKILERVGEAFKDAAGFVKDKSDEAGERPELQSNPALHK